MHAEILNKLINPKYETRKIQAVPSLWNHTKTDHTYNIYYQNNYIGFIAYHQEHTIIYDQFLSSTIIPYNDPDYQNKLNQTLQMNLSVNPLINRLDNQKT